MPEYYKGIHQPHSYSALFLTRKATGDHEELGFTVNARRSRRTRTEKTLDLDFADDIALLSDDLSTAQKLLSRVEAEYGRTGLQLDAMKTEHMAFNINSLGSLMASNGDPLKQVKDFKYFGSRMKSIERHQKEESISMEDPSTT